MFHHVVPAIPGLGLPKVLHVFAVGPAITATSPPIIGIRRSQVAPLISMAGREIPSPLTVLNSHNRDVDIRPPSGGRRAGHPGPASPAPYLVLMRVVSALKRNLLHGRQRQGRWCRRERDGWSGGWSRRCYRPRCRSRSKSWRESCRGCWRSGGKRRGGECWLRNRRLRWRRRMGGRWRRRMSERWCRR